MLEKLGFSRSQTMANAETSTITWREGSREDLQDNSMSEKAQRPKDPGGVLLEEEHGRGKKRRIMTMTVNR